MAQVYFKDTGMLHINDSGKSELQLRALPDFNSSVHDTVNLATDLKSHKENPFFYVAAAGDFFNRVDNLHPLLVAAKSMFTALQWTAIELSIDQIGGVKEALDRFDVAKFSERITALKTGAWITAADEAKLLSVVP